jgi:hypothetical protein
MKSAGAEWDAQIEIGVGAFTLGAARAGLAWVDLEPEARTALHAVRSADVGVYKRHGARAPLKPGAIFSAADKAMGSRGWERIVGVSNQRELVAIYVPSKAASARNVKFCLVTVTGEELVVASARSNLEPVLELALNRPEWSRKSRSPHLPEAEPGMNADGHK